jgi:putative transcriptional regulator
MSRFEHSDMQAQNVKNSVTESPAADSLARPIDELLAAYGAGALDPARHALIASHLLLRPENRRFVRAMEDYASAGLLAADDLAPARNRDQRLSAIFNMAEPERVRAIPAEQGGLLPAPLLSYLGCDMDALGWRFVVPGVREVKIAESGRGEVSLIHVRAGRRLPQHTHEGSEITLVLKGTFVDPLGRYGRGDIAMADSSLEHSPQIEGDVDCICFAVTDAPLRLSSPVGRMIGRILSRVH